MSEFSENLKKARKQKGMTQAEIADLIGVAKSTYSLYESGKREPDVLKIKQLASVLNTTGDELLGIEANIDAYMEYIALRRRIGPDRLRAYLKALEVINDE